jgi:hypothetical protein
LVNSGPTAPVAPRPEEFGLDESLVSSMPSPFVASRRGLCIVVVYGSAAALVISAALALSGSVIAAVFFGGLLVAAGSVLLIPAVTGLVCAVEQCEHSWLCRRYAKYRALSEYRKALSTYESEQKRFIAATERSSHEYWLSMSRDRLVVEIGGLFRSRGAEVRELSSREDAGADFLVVDDASVTAVRCETGPVQQDRAFGRELAAVRMDTGADRLLLVSPAGVDSALVEYLASHSADVLDAGDLTELQSPTTR